MKNFTRTMAKDIAAMPMKMASMMTGTIDGEKRMFSNVHKARIETATDADRPSDPHNIPGKRNLKYLPSNPESIFTLRINIIMTILQPVLRRKWRYVHFILWKGANAAIIIYRRISIILSTNLIHKCVSVSRIQSEPQGTQRNTFTIAKFHV